MCTQSGQAGKPQKMCPSQCSSHAQSIKVNRCATTTTQHAQGTSSVVEQRGGFSSPRSLLRFALVRLPVSEVSELVPWWVRACRVVVNLYLFCARRLVRTAVPARLCFSFFGGELYELGTFWAHARPRAKMLAGLPAG